MSTAAMAKSAHQENLMQVLARAARVGEGHGVAARRNQVVFKVRADATKADVRARSRCCSR